MNVHSWIFRNRARLRLIYGTPKVPSLKRPTAPSGHVRTPEGPRGTVQRGDDYVLLHPMGQRAS